MRVCWVGNIACPLGNIPPVSASADKATTCLSVCQMVIMWPFSFGLGVSLVGGQFIRYKWPAMWIRALERTR